MKKINTKNSNYRKIIEYINDVIDDNIILYDIIGNGEGNLLFINHLSSMDYYNLYLKRLKYETYRDKLFFNWLRKNCDFRRQVFFYKLKKELNLTYEEKEKKSHMRRIPISSILKANMESVIPKRKILDEAYNSLSVRELAVNLGINVYMLYKYLNVYNIVDDVKNIIKQNNINKNLYFKLDINYFIKILRDGKIPEEKELRNNPSKERYFFSKLKKFIIYFSIFEEHCDICNYKFDFDIIKNKKVEINKIPIYIKFINGNKYDTHISNLKLICSNCKTLYSNSNEVYV